MKRNSEWYRAHSTLVYFPLSSYCFLTCVVYSHCLTLITHSYSSLWYWSQETRPRILLSPLPLLHIQYLNWLQKNLYFKTSQEELDQNPEKIILKWRQTVPQNSKSLISHCVNEPSDTLSFSCEGQRQVSVFVTGRAYENFRLVFCDLWRFFWFGFSLFCFVRTANSLILLYKEILREGCKHRDDTSGSSVSALCFSRKK